MECVILSENENQILDEIASLKKYYDLTDEGPLQDYLGTRFRRNDDIPVTLTQLILIVRAL